MDVDVLTDTGAYGNHGPGVLFHGSHESLAVYRAPTRRVNAEAVYTNNPPSGAFRGYGLGQVMFGLESAMDELARRVGITRSSSGAATRSRRATRSWSPTPTRRRTCIGRYGLAGGLELVEAALAEPGETRPRVRTGGSAPAWRSA